MVLRFVVINNQSLIKGELLTEIRKVDEKVNNLDNKLDVVEERLTKRIDKLGLQIAKLEDDTPTLEDFDQLEKRVGNIESNISSI